MATQERGSFRLVLSAEEQAALKSLSDAGGVSKSDTLRLLLRDAANVGIWRTGTPADKTAEKQATEQAR